MGVGREGERKLPRNHLVGRGDMKKKKKTNRGNTHVLCLSLEGCYGCLHFASFLRPNKKHEKRFTFSCLSIKRGQLHNSFRREAVIDKSVCAVAQVHDRQRSAFINLPPKTQSFFFKNPPPPKIKEICFSFSHALYVNWRDLLLYTPLGPTFVIIHHQRSHKS